MEQPTSKGVSLSGQISEKNNQLVIDYQLSNGGKEPIYVWDLMVNYNDKGQYIDHDLAYVFWEEPTTLRVVRAMLNLPPDQDIYFKEVPYTRKVPVGGAVKGRISLSIPVMEYSPFYSPPKEVREVRCVKVRLLIGWSEFREGMVLYPQNVGGEQVLAIRGGWKEPIQELAEEIFDFSVGVMVRIDRFDRQMPMQ